MQIYIAHIVKINLSHAGSLSSSGSEFQTVGPTTGKARSLLIT